MKRFINRYAEIEELEGEYNRKGSSFVVIYGRRRVGKTTLISNFIKDKNALFFLASEESEWQNMLIFQKKAAEFTQNELLRDADIKSWDTIFKAIMTADYESKPVIVMDEFQYIGKSNSAFPSVLQRIWEEILKDKEVMLILCGSLVSMIESQVLNYNSPLYGRRTSQIRLTQIPFKHYHEFFPDKERHELIEMYAITGGVPKYIELFSEADDIYSAIKNNVLGTSKFLYEEPQFLLRQEVSEIGSYFTIIRAIAAGKTKISEIASFLEVKATSLTKYLKTLIDLDIIERKIPITEKNPERSKKGLYRIKDNFIRFWFLFVYPNRSYIERGNTEFVMQLIRKNLVTSHVSYVYEDVCREKMWDLSDNGKLPFRVSKVGSWWNSKTEIDIAAINFDEKKIILGECKFWKDKVGMNILRVLEEKARTAVPESSAYSIYYILFSAAGFTDELKSCAQSRKDLLLFDDLLSNNK
ncbi:MAG TPA: ATP-binding protein [Clostridia bacterium]|jgi:AAA+ ATPase superfamily predicted ATPase|nr:ATP-binding protein [Clostridiaceae bacterium]HOM34447.1 ATP-binding protein [Clostridia bacterium]HOT70587.1 ATP-binding protein [Clostridia bacterium]HQG00657.1 ATP-binding protein [Clostridia bacterium]HQH65139.1 ATP-binding protein [Clostridia bacterium]